MQAKVIGIEVERIPLKDLKDQFHNLRIESYKVQNDFLETFEKQCERLRQLVIKRDKLIEEIIIKEIDKKIFELEYERKISMLQCNQALNDTQNQQTIQIDPDLNKPENEIINVKLNNEQKKQNQSLETRNGELKETFAELKRLLEDGELEKDLEKKINIEISVEIGQKITLNDDDLRAISRLMGFGKQKAIMSYLTCDKDEIKAINLLNIMNLYK